MCPFSDDTLIVRDVQGVADSRTEEEVQQLQVIGLDIDVQQVPIIPITAAKISYTLKFPVDLWIRRREHHLSSPDLPQSFVRNIRVCISDIAMCFVSLTAGGATSVQGTV